MTGKKKRCRPFDHLSHLKKDQIAIFLKKSAGLNNTLEIRRGLLCLLGQFFITMHYLALSIHLIYETKENKYIIPSIAMGITLILKCFSNLKRGKRHLFLPLEVISTIVQCCLLLEFFTLLELRRHTAYIFLSYEKLRTECVSADIDKLYNEKSLLLTDSVPVFFMSLIYFKFFIYYGLSFVILRSLFLGYTLIRLGIFINGGTLFGFLGFMVLYYCLTTIKEQLINSEFLTQLSNENKLIQAKIKTIARVLWSFSDRNHLFLINSEEYLKRKKSFHISFADIFHPLHLKLFEEKSLAKAKLSTEKGKDKDQFDFEKMDLSTSNPFFGRNFFGWNENSAENLHEFIENLIITKVHKKPHSFEDKAGIINLPLPLSDLLEVLTKNEGLFLPGKTKEEPREHYLELNGTLGNETSIVNSQHFKIKLLNVETDFHPFKFLINIEDRSDAIMTEKLIELDKVKDRLLATIAHDMRNPLHLVIAMLEKVEGTIFGDPQILGKTLDAKAFNKCGFKILPSCETPAVSFPSCSKNGPLSNLSPSLSSGVSSSSANQKQKYFFPDLNETVPEDRKLTPGITFFKTSVSTNIDFPPLLASPLSHTGHRPSSPGSRAGNRTYSSFFEKTCSIGQNQLSPSRKQSELRSKDAENAGPLKLIQESLKIAETNSVLLLNLVSDILDYSLFKEEKMKVVTEEFSLAQTLKEVNDLISFQAQNKGLTIHVMNNYTKDSVYSDKRRLKQVLINLLTNSLKFAKRNGSINIFIEEKQLQRALKFDIIDTGVGIKKENLDKLFKPYQTFDSSEGQNKEGIGLGLFICKAIISKIGPLEELFIDSLEGLGTKVSFFIFNDLRTVKEHDENHNLGKNILKIEAMKPITNTNFVGSKFMRSHDMLSISRSCELVVAKVEGLKTQKENKKPEENFQRLSLQGNLDEVPLDKSILKRSSVVEPEKNFYSDKIMEFSSSNEISFVSKKNLDIKVSNSDNDVKQIGRKNEIINVMVVDDNPFNAICLETLIKKSYLLNNIKTITAYNGAEAVENFIQLNQPFIQKEAPLHLIFMDCLMPILNGYEASSKIKKLVEQEKYIYCYIVGCTAMKCDEEEKKRCLEAGMDAVIEKPVDDRKLNSLLRGLFI